MSLGNGTGFTSCLFAVFPTESLVQGFCQCYRPIWLISIFWESLLTGLVCSFPVGRFRCFNGCRRVIHKFLPFLKHRIIRTPEQDVKRFHRFCVWPGDISLVRCGLCALPLRLVTINRQAAWNNKILGQKTRALFLTVLRQLNSLTFSSQAASCPRESRSWNAIQRLSTFRHFIHLFNKL